MKTKPVQPAPKESSILSQLQDEIGTESAPLLQFITNNAAWIASAVICLLLVLCAMGIWNWYQGSKMEEAKNELALINLKMSGEEKENALKKLLETAPESLKLYIYLNLGQTAEANKNTGLAIDSYEKAAEIGESSALGYAAQIGSASLLMEQGKFSEALTKLQKLAAAAPSIAQMSQFKLLLAEAAVNANDKSLAIKTYEELAAHAPQREAAYYRNKIKKLEN